MGVGELPRDAVRLDLDHEADVLLLALVELMHPDAVGALLEPLEGQVLDRIAHDRVRVHVDVEDPLLGTEVDMASRRGLGVQVEIVGVEPRERHPQLGVHGAAGALDALLDGVGDVAVVAPREAVVPLEQGAGALGVVDGSRDRHEVARVPVLDVEVDRLRLGQHLTEEHTGFDLERVLDRGRMPDLFEEQIGQVAAHLAPHRVVDEQDVVDGHVGELRVASLDGRVEAGSRQRRDGVGDHARRDGRARALVVLGGDLGLECLDGRVQVGVRRRQVDDERADGRVAELVARDVRVDVRPHERVLGLVRELVVVALQSPEARDSVAVLLAAVDLLRVDEVEDVVERADRQLVEPSPQDLRIRPVVPDHRRRVEAEVPIGDGADEVVVGDPGLVLEGRSRAEAPHVGTEDRGDAPRAHDLVEASRDRPVGRGQVPELLPDRLHAAVLEADDVAEVLDELPAARAVMLRVDPVDRIRTRGEGCEVGVEQVVDAHLVQLELRQRLEAALDSLRENLEAHG